MSTFWERIVETVKGAVDWLLHGSIYVPAWTLGAFCLLPLYYPLRYLWELVPVRELQKKAVFIAGADSGFGYLLALKCAAKGMTVFAGCLERESREALEEQGAMLPGEIVGVPLDVTNDESVREASQFVRDNLREGQCLWALVNNAGYFSVYGPDEWTGVELYQHSLEVNLLGGIRCVHAFMPMLKQSRGRIVGMASVFARLSLPYCAPYSLAKSATESYMDALRQELRPFGISCAIIEPGGFHTNFLSLPEHRQRVEKVWAALPPETREEYGEQFKQKYLDDFAFMVRWASKRLNVVVENYFHAVTGKWPRLRYRCGWQAASGVPISFLPTELLDFCLQFSFGCRRYIGALRRAKK